MKHMIAVLTPTNVKMASLDQGFVDGSLDPGSLGFIGSARIGVTEKRGDKSRKESIIRVEVSGVIWICEDFQVRLSAKMWWVGDG
jgi:hypothetical protein